jgi:lauroyl/myristoyl acyltransferase
LIGLSLGRAVLDPWRVRRAYAWLAAGGAGGRSPWPILAGLLVHRARAAAVSPFIGLTDPDRARRHLDVRGLGHLEAARRGGGVVLLGFHLGMPGLNRVLGLLGYEITAIAGGSRFRFPPPTARWRAAVAHTPRAHKWTEREPGSQAEALYRLRKTAVAGGIVMIMGSGGRGRVLFDLPLPGRPLAVRAGWYVLRRQTGLATLPVLAHREGARWVVEIHPPLPAPDPDEGRDREACREALARILGDFVARYPEQCHFLALNVDDLPPAPPGGVPPTPS